MQTEQPIGLIGLGLLGTAIAKRLLKDCYHLLGHDIDPSMCKRFEELGDCSFVEAGDVFRDCRIVILSLPDSQAVSGLLNENQSALQAGLTIIDTTTGNPDEMMTIAGRLKNRGISYIEANVAGSSEQLIAGEACLFLAGENSTIQENQILINTISPQQFYIGTSGSAARFKLVHNLTLGLHRAVLAEALTFAEALGIDPAMTLEILKQTPAASQTMTTKGEKMLTADRAPQARLAQHLKDVELILEQANKTGASTPLSQHHRTLLEKAVELGLADADNSSIIEVFRRPSV